MTAITAEQLAELGSDHLLTALVQRLNGEWAAEEAEAERVNGYLAELETRAKMAEQGRDGYKRQVAALAEDNAKLQQQIRDRDGLMDQASKKVAEARGYKEDAIRLRTQIKALQQEITQLKTAGDPAKLRKQLKEAQAKAGERLKTIERLKGEAKMARTVQAKADQLVIELRDELLRAQKQLAHDTGSGLYHKGQHHLIIWPQQTTFERADGSSYSGRSLLYLHQSGRGGLISLNPDSGEVQLCAAPKGGLRPSDDALQFAGQWLWKVNNLQSGTVLEEDMVPINFNGLDGTEAA